VFDRTLAILARIGARHVVITWVLGSSGDLEPVLPLPELSQPFGREDPRRIVPGLGISGGSSESPFVLRSRVLYSSALGMQGCRP